MPRLNGRLLRQLMMILRFEFRFRWQEIALDQPEWRAPAGKSMSSAFGAGLVLLASDLASTFGVFEGSGRLYAIVTISYLLGRFEIRLRIIKRWRRRSPGGSSVSGSDWTEILD